MPYKHIAAHLKKTELACRLHYHQLSHGSNRRKRTTSVSSGSSVDGHSPVLPASMPSPNQEHAQNQRQQQHQRQHQHQHPYSHNTHSSPTPSPPSSSGSYGHLHHGMHAPSHLPGLARSFSHGHRHSHSIHLPSINTNVTNNHHNNHSSGINSASASGPASPRLPNILPRPVSTTLARNSSPAPPHNAPLLPAATFTASASTPVSATGSGCGATPPSLRLDCSGLPPLSLSSAGPHHPVDMARLHKVYSGHRASFWATIACEYGHGSNPVVLEQAWRTGGMPSLPGLSSAASSSFAGAGNGTAPLTPSASPDERETFYGVKGSKSLLTTTGTSTSTSTSTAAAGAPADKTRIAAILGIDANPRSPKEREMVRRLEEERIAVAPVA